MQSEDGYRPPPPAAIGPPRITDEDLVNAGPSVRALWVGRLEKMWEPVARQLEDDAQHIAPIDPRMLEIGLRICKQETDLYRLSRPPVVGDPEAENDLGPGVDRAALIEAKLVEIETRYKEQK